MERDVSPRGGGGSEKSTLFSLACYTFINDFLHTTPYTDLLPEAKSFFAHPIIFLGRYLEVYKMHTAYISAQTAERRRKRVMDVEKRAAYQKAHGIHRDVPFGGWWAKSDGEVMGPGITLTFGSPPEDDEDAAPSAEEYAEQVERERERRRRRPVKRWFGIWE